MKRSRRAADAVEYPCNHFLNNATRFETSCVALEPRDLDDGLVRGLGIFEYKQVTTSAIVARQNQCMGYLQGAVALPALCVTPIFCRARASSPFVSRSSG